VDDTSDLPITVIFNPGSGHGDGDESRKAIEEALTGSGREHRLLLVRSAEELESTASRIVDHPSRA